MSTWRQNENGTKCLVHLTFTKRFRCLSVEDTYVYIYILSPKTILCSVVF